MNDQSVPPRQPSRRQFLTATAIGTAVGALPLRIHAAQPAAVPLDQYKPEYLEAPEWAFIMAATARLIPAGGDGPSAHDARVPVFIDRQLAGKYGAATDWYMEGPHDPAADPNLGYQTPLNPAQIYRQGIEAVNAWCTANHGKLFAELAPDRQDEVLASLQKGAVKLPAELRDFFTLLLGNTKEGYFADPMYGGNHRMLAWSYIGFPGARASFKEWADQYDKAYPLGPVSISGERA
ncbi:hypothetical protein CDEN61S_00252 [Castellaniella denitrificans]|uniref:gluconate 2-dehydrogenase subunit 3 family protein n=1 Tax=Castellaniella sp. TaxID=1955812 RepID=UPI002AFF8ABF|nr:gluconate 2-dehydrogenase subunit 3 family protein [Castellaniella sp.]